MFLFERYVDKIGKISKGILGIYLFIFERNGQKDMHPYLLLSAHFTCRQDNMHEKWGHYGSHGMFVLCAVLVFLREFLLLNEACQTYFHSFSRKWEETKRCLFRFCHLKRRDERITF